MQKSQNIYDRNEYEILSREKSDLQIENEKLKDQNNKYKDVSFSLIVNDGITFIVILCNVIEHELARIENKIFRT